MHFGIQMRLWMQAFSYFFSSFSGVNPYRSTNFHTCFGTMFFTRAGWVRRRWRMVSTAFISTRAGELQASGAVNFW